MVKVCAAHNSCPPTIPIAFPAADAFILKGKYPAKQHCRNVAARLPGSDGLIYIEGQRTIYFEDSDYSFKFRQRRYFQYLTGVWDMADCAATYDIATDVLTLYIPPPDPSRILWSGPQPTPQDCLEKYDVDIVRYTVTLTAYLTAYHDNHAPYPIYTFPTPTLYLRSTVLTLNTTLLKSSINDCRVYKDAYEIALIKHANYVTALAHAAVLHSLRTAKSEADLEGIFISTSISQFAKSQAYPPIVASGTNAATLHYEGNSDTLENRQLLLLDAAVEWQGYAADVTRTFPISGHFTKEGKQIYELVDKMQSECIAASVAGVDWADTHFLAHRIAIKGLLALGILTNGTEEEIFKAGTSKAFFPHGLGHFIGLEVHDVEGTPNVSWTASESSLLPQEGEYAEFTEYPHFAQGRPGGAVHATIRRVLEPGMVITVEPGIYFSKYVIGTYLADPKHAKFIDTDVLEKYWDVGGVRLEDDVVILESGNEVISTAPRGFADGAVSLMWEEVMRTEFAREQSYASGCRQ